MTTSTSIICFLVTFTHGGDTFDVWWGKLKLVQTSLVPLPIHPDIQNFNKFLINWVFLQRVSLSPPGHFRLINDTLLPTVLQTWDTSQDLTDVQGWVKKNDPFSRPLLLDWGEVGWWRWTCDTWIRLEVYHANIKYLYFELHFQI